MSPPATCPGARSRCRRTTAVASRSTNAPSAWGSTSTAASCHGLSSPKRGTFRSSNPCRCYARLTAVAAVPAAAVSPVSCRRPQWKQR
jgi:hypothetical protein